jgi:hypothetical protein
LRPRPIIPTEKDTIFGRPIISTDKDITFEGDDDSIILESITFEGFNEAMLNLLMEDIIENEHRGDDVPHMPLGDDCPRNLPTWT